MATSFKSYKKDELVALCEEYSQKLETLESKLDAEPDVEQPDTAPRLPNLAVRAWLPKSLDAQITRRDGTTFNPVQQGLNKKGEPWIKFDIQLNHYDDRAGKRFYSKFRLRVKAMGAVREQIIELINSKECLVELTASYLPYEMPATEDLPATQRDEFYLQSVTPVPRKEKSQAADQAELDF